MATLKPFVDSAGKAQTGSRKEIIDAAMIVRGASRERAKVGANFWLGEADQNLRATVRLWRPNMRMIIEARPVDDQGGTDPVRLLSLIAN